MEAKILELSNGLRVIFKPVSYTRAVHVGLVIDAGSRDDLQGEMGMAHFIEHMIFKGTAKRKTFHILNYLESVGGDLNAYTTKEKTALYASVTSENFERAVELLADIAFHSVFPEKEIAKEKQVIAEEIDLYRNIPDEAIFEDFDELIFPRHGLGHPILGTKSSIRDFDQQQVKRHLGRSLLRENLVFSIVGNVPEKRVNRVLEKYLSHQILPEGRARRLAPPADQLLHKQVDIPAEQAHEIIGGRAYAMRKELYVPFLVLNNLLGGPAMSSRLNLDIREKHGLTYNISSFYSPYLDTGIWGVYYACEARNIERIRKLVGKELERLANRPLGSLRLNQARKQLVGQLTLGYENLLGQMLGMAKDLLDFGEIMPFAKMISSIESVTSSEIQEAADEIFFRNPQSLITYRKPA